MSCLTRRRSPPCRRSTRARATRAQASRSFRAGRAGSEQGWGTYIVNPARAGAHRILPRATCSTIRRGIGGRSTGTRTSRSSTSRIPCFSATSRDSPAFKANGGSLIMYTGWADPVTPAAGHDHLLRRRGEGDGRPRRTQAFFRFFPVPGMGHCSGGPGPTSFDALAALGAVAGARGRAERLARRRTSRWRRRSVRGRLRVSRYRRGIDGRAARRCRELQLRPRRPRPGVTATRR